MAELAIAHSNGAALAPLDPKIMELVLMGGDLSKLTPQQRVAYMLKTCESLGLNPYTKPFDFINLNNKLVMYAKKDCTEQLRNIHAISIKIMAREVVEGVYVVTAQATKKDGRQDESIGAVPIEQARGEARANAMMKAETKAKRRVTLSICGLGMLDESEIDSIPGARPVADESAPLEEKLKASLAAESSKKKAAQLASAAEAQETLEGEIVPDEPPEADPNEFRMPIASTKGYWKEGDPISTVHTDHLKLIVDKWKPGKDGMHAAAIAELLRRP